MPNKVWTQQAYVPGKTDGSVPVDPKTFGSTGGVNSVPSKTSGTAKKTFTQGGGVSSEGGGVTYGNAGVSYAGANGVNSSNTKTTGTGVKVFVDTGGTGQKSEGGGVGTKGGFSSANGVNVTSKPTTGLGPEVVIDNWTPPDIKVENSGQRVGYLPKYTPEYKEWENKIIEQSVPISGKEVKDLNPRQFLPPDIAPPLIIKDDQNKFWVFNECNQRWWTPDYTVASSVQGGMSPSIGITGNSVGNAAPAIMWNSWDHINQTWLRRDVGKWCQPDNPNEPPMDDCARYGINCPEGLSSGKVFTRIDTDDKLPLRSELVTYGIWSNNTGSMTLYYTCSTSQASESYYRRVYNKPCNSCCSDVQFDIAYGHDGGSGSADLGGFDWITPTNAVYSQYRLLCLEPTKKRFTIGGRELEHIYVINIKRDRMVERVDEGNLELNLAHLSGSLFEAGGRPRNAHTGSNVKVKGTGQILRLIDDSILDLRKDLNISALSSSYSEYTGSDTLTHRSTQAGMVYHMVSGSLEGGVYNKSNPQVFGLMYPNLGIIVLDADKLDSTASFLTCTGSDLFGDNPHKLYTAMSGAALYTDESGDVLGFTARRKVTEYSEYYFIRIKNADYNFTNNPTYRSGSDGMIIDDFVNNHKVYYTTIGLFNEQKECLAIGKISRALQKSYTTEGLTRMRIKY